MDIVYPFHLCLNISLVISRYFRILKISSVLSPQNRYEVLVFKFMVPVQDSFYLHLESPSYLDSTDSLWDEVPKVFDSKFKLETQLEILHTVLFSYIESVSSLYFYSFLSNIN